MIPRNQKTNKVTERSINKFKPRPSELLTDGKSLRSSEKEHKADALALGADEGRDKLR